MNILEYIGKKYESGSRGPDTFDCWGLVMSVYEKEYGIKLYNQPARPEAIVDVVRAFKEDTSEGNDWVISDKLEEGVVVTCGRNKYLTHAGVCIGQNLVMHTTKEAGCVVVQTIHQIKRTYPLVRLYNHKNR